jgi:hypothetical protein
MSMIYHHTKFHVPIFNCSFVTAIGLQAIHRIHGGTKLFRIVSKRKKSKQGLDLFRRSLLLRAHTKFKDPTLSVAPTSEVREVAILVLLKVRN